MENEMNVDGTENEATDSVSELDALKDKLAELDSEESGETPDTQSEGGNEDGTAEEVSNGESDNEEGDSSESDESGSDNADTEEEQLGGDPWSWADGIDPDKIKKTWEKFTPAMQSVRARESELEDIAKEIDAERERLAPVIALNDYIEANPDFVDYINEYKPAAGGVNLQESEALSRAKELEERVQKQEVESNLRDLHTDVSAKGLPDFDDTELITFAIDNGINNLKAAYHMMNVDSIVSDTKERAKKETEAAIKKNAGKKTIAPSNKAGGIKTPPTPEEIGNMSEQDFLASVPDLAKLYQ